MKRQLWIAALVLALAFGAMCLPGSAQTQKESRLPVIIPIEGTAHPVFQRLNKGEIVDIYLTFDLSEYKQKSSLSRVVKAPQLALQIMKPFQAWKSGLAKSAPNATVFHEFKGNCLNVALGGTPQPSSAVDTLIQAYRAAEIPLQEVLLIPRTVDEDGRRGEALADPRMPAIEDPADEAAFWRAVFDSTRPTPPSEDPDGMLSMAAFSKGTKAFELRAMPLYLTDVRIVYGTPRVDVFDADPRSTQVGQILREKLNQRFVGQVPEFVNNRGEAHQVMRVGHDKRIGYSFAIRRSAEATAPLVARYPSSFRFREYELMLALRDTAQSLDLDPVILWLRGDSYIFNLWETQR